MRDGDYSTSKLMSNKYFRQVWIQLRYRETMRLFHENRALPENEHIELADLARSCAVAAFYDNADSIIGDKDACAREFMSHVREHIADEINAAIIETPQIELVC